MLDYGKQQVLIVDDFPEFRMNLKGVMQQLGARDIDVAPDGETAIKMCSKKSYDIVLSDYNLGEGKDGQQLLEELASRDYLKPTTVYVMVTAENTTEMVMAALEHTPDSYLTKPFTKDLLRSRLDKLLHKKISLEKINRAIITKNYPKALKLADQMIAAGSKYAMACMRIKADLYLKMADLKQAHSIFNMVLSKRPIPWALIGMGKLLYAQEKYDEARTQFQKVLQQLPNYPEALDWIARIQAVNGDIKEAQKTLQTAISVTPKVSQRQLRLGDLARHNRDYEVAKRAYRAAIKHSKDSVHRDPDNYLNLVSVLTEELTSGGGIKNKRISTEALTYLKNLEEDFANDKEIKLRAAISRHAIYHKLGRKVETDKYRAMAKSLFTELSDSASGHATTDMAGAYLREEDYDSCQSLLTKGMEKFGDDPDIMASVEMMVEDKGAFEKAVQASKINSKGIQAHTSNHLDEAIQHFREALAISPDNVSFNMNLAQVLISKCEQSSDHASILDDIDKIVENLSQLNPRDYRYVRYMQLQRMANDIRIGDR
jgi:CheY-like chemotaxis protein/Flp pilus assembly protein TadD